MMALEFEAAGRYVEARAEVELALAGGAGRDAQLLAAKLAILREDLDGAVRLLEPLAADTSDALVLYNLGLIAHKRNEYNNARTYYLAAARADPTFAAARYNLAILAADAGVTEEAHHHAQKLFETAPQDPLSQTLRERLYPSEAVPPPAVEAPTGARPESPSVLQPKQPPRGEAPAPTRSGDPPDAGLKDPFAGR